MIFKENYGDKGSLIDYVSIFLSDIEIFKDKTRFVRTIL